jgi:hypothetical protein
MVITVGLRPDLGGSVEVSIDDGAVTIKGTNCLYILGDPAKERSGEEFLTEVYLTVPLSRCQIFWKIVPGELKEPAQAKKK